MKTFPRAIFVASLLAASVFLTSCNRQSESSAVTSHAQDKNVAISPAAQAKQISAASGVSLSIAIPLTSTSHDDEGILLHDGRKFIRQTSVNSADSSFAITIRNATNENKTVSEDWCSYGYFNLYFQILDDTGAVIYEIKKKEGISWNENWHDYSIVMPHDIYARIVHLDDSCWHIPTPNDLPKGTYLEQHEMYRSVEHAITVKMRAVYEGDGMNLKSPVDNYKLIYSPRNW